MMRTHKILLIIVISISSFTCCFSQDIVLNSQSAIDAFDSSITIIEGDLQIGSSPLDDPIIDLSNLSNLTSIQGDFIITGQKEITDLTGLNNLNSVGGFLDINYSNSLLSLEGLNQLSYVGERLRIRNNWGLLNLNGLDDLFYVGEDIQIKENNALLTLGSFEKLTFINGTLVINENNELVDVNGLENVEIIFDKLEMRANDALTSLEGFRGLEALGGLLMINNHALTSLDGFENIDTVFGGFLIGNNSVLVDCCAIQELLTTPNVISNSISIYDNATDFETEIDIIATDCFTATSGFMPNNLQVFPNPVTNYLKVFHEDTNLDFTLFSTNGKLIESGSLSTYAQLDFSNLEVGVYYLKIEKSGSSNVKKILKVR